MDSQMQNKNSKKGLLLTSNRLETSRAVQNALVSAGDEQGPAFLKDCADMAIAILRIIQSIDDGDIDPEFVNLALDGCGLVYLITHICTEHMDRQTAIARDMRSDAKSLVEDLKSIHLLFQKKASGSLYRRVNPRKRSEDAQKIAYFRTLLKRWMVTFGGTTQGSIHDSLEELMAKKLQEQEAEHNNGARKVKESLVSIQAVGSLASNLENLRIRNDEPHGNTYSPIAANVAMPIPVVHPPHPSLSMSQLEIPASTAMPKPVVHSAPSMSTTPLEFPFPISSTTEADLQASEAARLKQKREEERWIERERLRIAEQEFNNLPFSTPLTHASQDQHPSHVRHDMSFMAEMPGPRIAEEDDAAAARALHENFQREFELQDRQQAILEAGKLQQMMEAEEEELMPKRKRGSRKRPSHHDPNVNGPSSSPPVGPSPPQTFGPMSFDNLHGTGVSIGGGPVHVYNGGGNTTTITYRDSHNDNSVRYYGR